MKELTIKNKKGQSLAGIFHSAEKNNSSIIILVHGFTGNKNGPDNIFVKTSEELSKNGFAVLRFDFSGSGESDGKFEDMTISGEVRELKMFMNFARGMGFENIGILGESLGGAVSVLAYDPGIKCMVLWYPALNLRETNVYKKLKKKEYELKNKGYISYEKSHGRVFKIGKGFYEERGRFDVSKRVKSIKCPLMIITGDKDSSVPFVQSVKAIKTVNEPKELGIIKGADHCFRGDKREEWQKKAIEFTVSWFKKWLK
jgi:hypothetical protein